MILGAFFAIGLAGCAGAPNDASEDEVFTQTSVHLNPDGTKRIEQTTITLSQELALNAARARAPAARADGLGEAAQAIAWDPGCDPSGLWLYDQAGGIGNRICFDGAGVAKLDNRPARLGLATGYDWAGKVRSYWPGNEDGDFTYYVGGWIGQYDEYFSAWPAQGLTDADWLVEGAQFVTLY
jgi:hypothetical protein